MAQAKPLEVLTRGVVDIHVAEEFEKKLKSGKPLRLKAGFDPTRPDLHLGHVVLLRKLRQFQDAGHTVVFVVGDFTAQIGDPSGRNSTRPVPTRQEIEAGAQSYAEQAFKVLDKQRTEVVYNSAWLSKLAFEDVIRLAGKYRLARMMERDDFKKRWDAHESISIHELLYPLVQAFDSVELKPDIEFGGTDQLFNLLVGREMMREYNLPPQVVMTMPILEGTNARVEGGKIVGDKMSKSLDNYIAVNESADEQFGKVMSINDTLMWRYYALLSDRDEKEIAAQKKACEDDGANPRDAKVALALEIAGFFHGADAARAAQQRWENQFSKQQVPDEMPAHEIKLSEKEIWLPKLLADLKLAKSSSDARRLIEQGAVEINGDRVRDVQTKLSAGTYTIRAGKRAWAKAILS